MDFLKVNSPMLILSRADDNSRCTSGLMNNPRTCGTWQRDESDESRTSNSWRPSTPGQGRQPRTPSSWRPPSSREGSREERLALVTTPRDTRSRNQLDQARSPIYICKLNFSFTHESSPQRLALRSVPRRNENLDKRKQSIMTSYLVTICRCSFLYYQWCEALCAMAGIESPLIRRVGYISKQLPQSLPFPDFHNEGVGWTAVQHRD